MDKNYFLTIAKTAVIFAAIGCLLSLAAPHIAVAVGLFDTVGSACWALGFGTSFAGFVGYNSLFFSGFGTLNTTITPLVDKFLLRQPAAAPAAEAKAPTLTASGHEPAPPSQPASDREQEPAAADTVHFRNAELSKLAARATHAGTNSLH